MRFGLTDRETEVMQLLSESCSYKEIASSLGISMATVKTHVSRVYKKTGVSGRSELKYRFREPL
ncbi:helix-turn-helix transcriptional regulator [Oceanispirochaeta sp. M2]|nr:helix-turn-helix transcriptional regulator [Oceanispirochaeta sp. M2]NPD74492.1 helix-turn-helix transcriptional regulator [Oceanispirochaeta sp. M1]